MVIVPTRFFCLLLMFASTGACRARHETSPSVSVDALFADWNRPDSPGCAVGVSRRGAVVFERGYGMANLAQRTAITPATVFDVASISKPMTAMSIMLLAEQGRLSLDDEVWRHVPEWTNRRDRLTIRHLLAHTGGLRDVFLLIELAPPPAAGVALNDHLLAILARQRGLNVEPGRSFSYNNGGYNLLGGVVQRVSGLALGAFAREHIFTPLEMTQTILRDGTAAIPSQHVLGYHQDERGFALAREGGVDTSGIVGNSGVSTTVRDLLRWQQNLTDARVSTRANLDLMQTPVMLGDGSQSPYGLGLEVGEDRGFKTVGHGGGDRGVAAYLIRYGEPDLGVAVLCNLDNLGFRAGALARQVAAAFLPVDRSDGRQPASPPVVSVPAETLAGYAGLYRDPSDDTYGRVYMRDGRLMASTDAGDGPGDSVELTPIGPDRFVVPGTPVVAEFKPGANGRPQQISVTGIGPTPLVSEQVVTGFAPSPAQLTAFAGRYVNVDLDVTYTIVVRDAGLVVHVPGRAAISLAPIFPDAFYGSLVDLVKFSRAPGGRVTGFAINRTSVRNLRFERVD